MSAQTMIQVDGLSKTFTRHNQGGVTLPVFEDLNFRVSEGECVVLDGPSGSGKSTLMRSLYANYRPSRGRILVRHGGDWIDIAAAPAQSVLAVRRHTLGYVSQFLRVIPRISTLDIVTEPLRTLGVPVEEAEDRATTLLSRLRLPESLWALPPATFSGGEQQRVNIARSFVQRYPILLLDEPTASLDGDNRETVIELIREALSDGTAIVGIFHDQDVRKAVATTRFAITDFKKHAA